MTEALSSAEELKFALLADGMTITAAAAAYLDQRNGDRPLTPHDYASTSGLILALADDVWVNAPVREYNPNFVTSNTPFELVLEADDVLAVQGAGLHSGAKVWLPPAYHGELNSEGEPYNSYAFTHSDRVRISPVEGCSMTCKFCDLPYEFRYRTKRVAGLVDSVRVALEDPLQPAHHVLISGGTPREPDIPYVAEAYEQVVRTFAPTAVDVMMVPIQPLMDPEWLHEIGVNELSVNIEIFNRDLGRKLMRKKAAQGLDLYLDYLERAAGVFGPGRVRSMLMVGLEPMEDTVAGARAIAERGAVPVLSPFRPDPATPLRDERPPTAEVLRATYLRCMETVIEVGGKLGPSCIPCSHNTLSLAESGSGNANTFHGHPNLV